MMRAGRLLVDPLRMQAMKTAEVYLKGEMVRIMFEGARAYGFGVVPGRFIDNLCEIEGIKLRLYDGRGVKHAPV